MESGAQDRIYQRIGEFVVGFQWLETSLREIGWLILDPLRQEWPPTALRSIDNAALIDRVHELFVGALSKCNLGMELEAEYLAGFAACATELHRLRRARNRIIHSAYIELKAGGEIAEVMRVDNRLRTDEDGKLDLERECLSPKSFENEMAAITRAGLFLSRAYAQLIARLGSVQQIP